LVLFNFSHSIDLLFYSNSLVYFVKSNSPESSSLSCSHYLSFNKFNLWRNYLSMDDLFVLSRRYLVKKWTLLYCLDIYRLGFVLYANYSLCLGNHRATYSNFSFNLDYNSTTTARYSLLSIILSNNLLFTLLHIDHILSSMSKSSWWLLLFVFKTLFVRSSIYSYDTIVHQISPNLIIIIFSILLLLRIRQQKIRIGKSLRWRKHWKMTVQLLFISILYLVFALPIAFFNFLHLCGVEESLIFNVMEYLLFFNYLAMLFCPFSCALSLPQLRNQVRKCVRFDTTRRTIAPTLRTIPQALENETAV